MSKERRLVITEKSEGFCDLLWRFFTGDWDWILNTESFTKRVFRQSTIVYAVILILTIIVFLIFCFIFNKGINCKCLSSLCSFLKDDYKWFLGAYGIIFAYLRKIYSDKWKYCADLYNKINELDITDKRNGANTDLMKNTLAIDILDLKVWSNKSFNDFLVSELKEVKEYVEEKIELNKPVCLSKVHELLYIRHDSLIKRRG